MSLKYSDKYQLFLIHFDHYPMYSNLKSLTIKIALYEEDKISKNSRERAVLMLVYNDILLTHIKL